MPLQANALTTVAALRAWLAQGATEETDGRLDDEALTALIGRASGAIESWCDRTLVAPAEARTYRLDGNGLTRLLLPEWPLLSLTSLTIDDHAIPEREAGGPGWLARAEEACLLLDGYTFTRGLGNVVAVARLGYDAATAATDRRHRRALDDLEQACLMLAAFWFEKPAAARLTVTIEGRGESYDSTGWPAEVRGLLAPYRRLGG